MSPMPNDMSLEGFSRRVVRVGVSPMNPKVKWAALECGHEVWSNRKRTVGKFVVCEKCKDKEPRR